MTLCDIGNTTYHFLKDGVDFKESVGSFEPSSMEDKIFFICVNQEIKNTLSSLENWIDLSLYVDMKNYYPTMGIDRIIALESVQNAIVIDAGSAVTVDVVNNGEFMGGFIYAGIKAMTKTYKSISPALEYEFNFDLDLDKLPKNSQDAISYGYLMTLQAEVMKHNLPIIITGGDAEIFSKIFPNALVDKQLLFKGMNNIIQYNSKEIK